MCASHSCFEAHIRLVVCIRVPDRACETGETAVWDVRRDAVDRRRPRFRPIFQFREVCTTKLSHFRGSLHDFKRTCTVSPLVRPQRAPSVYRIARELVTRIRGTPHARQLRSFCFPVSIITNHSPRFLDEIRNVALGGRRRHSAQLESLPIFRYGRTASRHVLNHCRTNTRLQAWRVDSLGSKFDKSAWKQSTSAP